MIELNGRKLVETIKEEQKNKVASFNRPIKLLILRDNAGPVISKYVEMKKKYGSEIGIEVVDEIITDLEEMKKRIADSREDGIIVQLPLEDKEKTDEVLEKIPFNKDVDGLRGETPTATAKAIDSLLKGYNIQLEGKKIAIVGRGRLVGKPLAKMWQDKDLRIFVKGDDLNGLLNFDVVVLATGVPRLIKTEYIKSGAVVVDAGTASDKGMIVGDADDDIRERTDLTAITPKIGGVGPMTVASLFQNLIDSTVTE
jgi:methylenetetrahydrofolate dehydrogenase (NADP+)/methenyltetrahydrofolate cyclohydrolase